MSDGARCHYCRKVPCECPEPRPISQLMQERTCFADFPAYPPGAAELAMECERLRKRFDEYEREAVRDNDTIEQLRKRVAELEADCMEWKRASELVSLELADLRSQLKAPMSGVTNETRRINEGR